MVEAIDDESADVDEVVSEILDVELELERIV